MYSRNSGKAKQLPLMYFHKKIRGLICRMHKDVICSRHTVYCYITLWKGSQNYTAFSSLDGFLHFKWVCHRLSSVPKAF